MEDQEKRKQIVATIHDFSRLGINRTLDLVASKYYWPGQSKDVMKYVSSDNWSLLVIVCK